MTYGRRVPVMGGHVLANLEMNGCMMGDESKEIIRGVVPTNFLLAQSAHTTDGRPLVMVTLEMDPGQQSIIAFGADDSIKLACSLLENMADLGHEGAIKLVKILAGASDEGNDTGEDGTQGQEEISFSDAPLGGEEQYEEGSGGYDDDGTYFGTLDESEDNWDPLGDGCPDYGPDA
jgi:hypothetical protein